jgi:hypothetical protein
MVKREVERKKRRRKRRGGDEDAAMSNIEQYHGRRTR